MAKLGTYALIAFAIAAGFVVLLPACLAHAWTGPTYPSIKSKLLDPKDLSRPFVDEWSWSWLNKWYGNSEDGVSGQYAFIWVGEGVVRYQDTFPSWVPKWAIAYCWSAWRNSANNLRRPLRSTLASPVT
jgi:hypothetical protein